MPQTDRTFRIFISSTFNDFCAERNALQERVFPRLRDLCLANGARFQPIDLRWGVSEEAGLDQRTIEICLAEIARSKRVSPRPNFIVLLGDPTICHAWSGLDRFTLSDHAGEVLQGAFSASGAMIVTAGADGALKLWATRDGALLNTMVGHDGRVRSFAFVRGDAALVSAGDEGSVRFWTVELAPRGTERHACYPLLVHTRWRPGDFSRRRRCAAAMESRRRALRGGT